MVSRTTSLLDSLHTMCADNGNQNKLAHSTIPHMLRCPIGRGRPRRTEHRTGALAFPGESRGSLGERRQYYKPRGILFQSSKRGAEGRWLCTPSPLPPVSPHPEGGNSDDKITAGLGRNRIGAGGVGVVLGGVPPTSPQPLTHPAIKETLAPPARVFFLKAGGLTRAKATRELKPSGL